MFRLLTRTRSVVLGAGLLATLLLLPMQALVPAAAAQSLTKNFDLVASVVPGVGWAIPTNCSTWHELYPQYCAPHHQAEYQDNGDGIVSACDNIVEDSGLTWHIESVTTTYFFSPVAGGGQTAAEPSQPTPDPSPVCETWHVVYSGNPAFSHCQSMHIDGWEDLNQNGTLDACDNIQIAGAWYHIDKVGCDVTVTGDPGTPTKHSSWGWLKNLFRSK